NHSRNTTRRLRAPFSCPKESAHGQAKATALRAAPWNRSDWGVRTKREEQVLEGQDPPSPIFPACPCCFRWLLRPAQPRSPFRQDWPSIVDDGDRAPHKRKQDG